MPEELDRFLLYPMHEWGSQISFADLFRKLDYVSESCVRERKMSWFRSDSCCDELVVLSNDQLRYIYHSN